MFISDTAYLKWKVLRRFAKPIYYVMPICWPLEFGLQEWLSSDNYLMCYPWKSLQP